MLASLTPLGERGRGSRWGITVAWLFAGAVAGGALIGAVLGGLGEAINSVAGVSAGTRALLMGVVVVAAGVVDLAPVRLPTTLRQVNAYWIGRYRGWVVGVGFGFQLGLGIGTIVTTATVYALLVVELLSASPVVGAAVGVVFGLARGAAVLPAGRIDTPSELFRLTGWFERHTTDAIRSAGIAAALVGTALIVTAIA